MGTVPICDLVVQGPFLSAALAEELSLFLGGPRVERIAERAYRLRDAPEDARVAAWCDARRLDHAYVPRGRRFAHLKLLAMDMDSTLITIECIDELGAIAGKKAEIAALTEQAMRGEIDYRKSLRRRVALLAGLDGAALARVYDERLQLTAGAETLLGACRRHGVKVLLVSGGFTYFTDRLRARLALDETIANMLAIRDGKLTGELIGEIVDADGKAAKFRAMLRALGAPKEASVAIGDGANDLKMMAEAGISVAFRAKPLVRARASCALNWSGLDAVLNLFE